MVISRQLLHRMFFFMKQRVRLLWWWQPSWETNVHQKLLFISSPLKMATITMATHPLWWLDNYRSPCVSKKTWPNEIVSRVMVESAQYNNNIMVSIIWGFESAGCSDCCCELGTCAAWPILIDIQPTPHIMFCWISATKRCQFSVLAAIF